MPSYTFIFLVIASSTFQNMCFPFPEAKDQILVYRHNCPKKAVKYISILWLGSQTHRIFSHPLSPCNSSIYGRTRNTRTLLHSTALHHFLPPSKMPLPCYLHNKVLPVLKAQLKYQLLLGASLRPDALTSPLHCPNWIGPREFIALCTLFRSLFNSIVLFIHFT